jgi:hypothetical protein
VTVLARLRRRWERALARAAGGRPADAGSAVVEFLGVALLLMVPLVYLVLTLGKVQGAVFASEGAAREAGRLVVRADTFEQGVARARAAVELAFADQGFDVSGADALDVLCERDPCLTPGSQIVIEVSAAIGLPGVPGFVQGAVPAQVPISAQFVAVVDEFREVPR